MNKLQKTLLIIEGLGWKSYLDKETLNLFEKMKKTADKITDDQLTEDELRLVEFVDNLLVIKFVK